MLTVPEVAERLRVAVSTVYALVESGKLGAFRIGPNDGAIRVSDEQLAAYLNACRTDPSATSEEQNV
ncbi:MAG: helix-turn-helix domain-containing protein [Planctomycetaceae bacterium]